MANQEYNNQNDKQLLQKRYKEASNLIDKLKPQLQMALPNAMTPERMARTALTEFRNNPKLLQCDPASLMKCIMCASQLGLEPGLLGHVYFVPYKQEAQMIIGYKGLIDLARRSGQIERLEAREVCENEICEIEYGTNAQINHKPILNGKERGKPIGYYAVASFKGGGQQFEWMSISEVEKIRNASPGKNSTPWVKHFDSMAKKTVIRRLFKYLPVSVVSMEALKASAIDESADRTQQQELLNTEFFDVDLETGEILNDNQNNTVSQSDEVANKLLNK